MNAEQKAIIAAAEKEGVSPIEKDARLIVHGMVNATRDQMRKYQVGFNNMGEAQQDAVIAELTKAYDDLAITIARALASAGSPFVIAQCKDLKISNGTFTGIIKSDQDHYNELISKVQDKGEVVLVLYERQYRDGVDAIKGDKDQRSLPLEGEKKSTNKKERASTATGSATSAANLAKTATILPAKLLEDARAFIDNQQVVTVSGMQNHLKIGAVKAGAVLEQMEAEGRVKFVGDSKSGEYQKVHTVKTDPAPENKAPATDLTFDGDGDQEEPQILTDELYEKIKASVVKAGKFSVGALLVSLDISEASIIEEAAERMEGEGLLTEENEAGIRTLVA